MNEQFVVIEGIVGNDAKGFSVHRHSARDGRDRYLAYVGLRDGSRLIWQEIEMNSQRASDFGDVLASGNRVRVSGLLKKQLGLPHFRVQVDNVQLLQASEPVAFRKAA
jgi:hypothetical protein